MMLITVYWKLGCAIKDTSGTNNPSRTYTLHSDQQIIAYCKLYSVFHTV